MKKNVARFGQLFCALTFLFFINTISLYAQQDSTTLRQMAGRAITERFPTTRLINVEYQYITPSDIKIKTHGKSLGKTTIKEQSRVKVNANVPLFRYRKWSFIGSFDYNYTTFSLKDKDPLIQEFGNIRRSDLEGHVFNTTLNAVYISKLFNKPLIYNMSVVGHFSEKGFERMTGFGIASMMLKRTQKISITTGLAVVVDPSIRFPVLPIFGLEYRFNDDWLFSLALPQYALIRRSFSKNTRLSLGSYFNGISYYVHPKDYKHTYLYSKAEINTGFVFEQYMNSHFIFTARTGMVNSLQGNLTQRNKTYSKRVITTDQNTGMYFNVGFSYNLY